MNILHVVDSREDAVLVGEIIKAEWPDCTLTCVASRFAFLGELHRRKFDLILSDVRLKAFNGLEALKLAKERAPEIPFIFLSGTMGEDSAIEALRSGAQDYVRKDGMKPRHRDSAGAARK